MRQKIENELTITCQDVDFTTSTDIEIYVRQEDLFLQYAPATVADEHTIKVIVPFADAMKLTTAPVSVQWALTDSSGKPVAPDPVTVPVGIFLKEAGYDPV